LAETRRQKLRFTRLALPFPMNWPREWLQLAWCFETPFALRVHVLEGRVMRYWLLLTEDGKPLGYAQRELRLDEGVARHDLIAIVPDKRGEGHGTQVMANAVRLYARLDIRQIVMTAGLSDGSAAWPKMGYRPADRDQWRRLRRVVSRNLKALDPRLRAVYDRTHGRSLESALQRILASEDPESVFELVDIDPGQRAAGAAGLKHGFAGVLLHGGRWNGVLDLRGEGGRRLQDYLQKKASKGEVALGHV
jgi:GNAT superfamily N-acetyltransferase